MSDEKFPEVQPGQPIKASRANEEGRVLERVARMLPGTGMSGRHGGSILQFGRTHDARLATLKVTNDDDAPVYLGVFRQYDFESGEWSDGDKPWKIDAGAVDGSLTVGDYIVAYYDRKRGAFIPISVGASVARRRFELEYALVAGGMTTAYLREAVGGIVSTTMTVFEVYDEMGEFEGDPGTYGMAEYWSDSEHWEIYQLACDPSEEEESSSSSGGSSSGGSSA